MTSIGAREMAGFVMRALVPNMEEERGDALLLISISSSIISDTRRLKVAKVALPMLKSAAMKVRMKIRT